MTSDKKQEVKLKAKLYILVLFLCWLPFFLIIEKNGNLVSWPILLLWGLFQITLESFYIKFKRGFSASLSFSTLVASIILFGPFTAGTIALFQAASWQEILSIEKTNKLKWLFNSIQNSIAALSAGIFYKIIGGLIFIEANHAFTFNNFPSQILPLVSAILVYYFVNSLLVNIAVSLNENVSIKDLWLDSLKSVDLNYLALGFMGIIFAQIYHLEPFALVLLIVPLAIARQSFSNYMKLEEAYSSTIGALIKAIEAKDPYTKGHSERVAILSEKIARQLNLPEDQVEAVQRIAALHDIGKIGIPKKILVKPGELTDKEFASIKEHPHIGARILKDVPFLKELIPAVYYHHEKVDGSGYTTGLSGTNIPLYARIIAIADSYDAMTSNRAYRKKLSKQVVIDQLLQNSGKQFDIIVVKALLEVLEIELNPKQQENLLQTRVLQASPT